LKIRALEIVRRLPNSTRCRRRSNHCRPSSRRCGASWRWPMWNRSAPAGFIKRR
jgi:hypothetical protein